MEGDQEMPSNAESLSRPPEHREGGLDVLEVDDDSAEPLSRARRVFNDSCLNHWLPPSDSRVKNAAPEQPKDAND